MVKRDGNNSLEVALRGVVAGGGWRADSVAAYDIELECDGRRERLRVQPARDGSVRVARGDAAHEVSVLALVEGPLRYRFDGVERRAVALHAASTLHLALGADSFVFEEPSAFAAADAGIDAARLRAPVAGVVSQLLVQAGDEVDAGQAVACVEAMKMEMWLAAPAPSRVLAVHVRAGEQVAAGALIVEFEPPREDTP